MVRQRSPKPSYVGSIPTWPGLSRVGVLMGIVSTVLLSILGFLVLFMLIYYRKNIIAFAVTARQEMKRVVWPTPEKAFRQMKAIVISLIIFACFFGLVDFVLYRLVNLVF